MRKPKEKIKLETKKVVFGQYGESEDSTVVGEFEAIENQYKKYASAIGSLIISFAVLEDSVNRELAETINGRGYEPGYRVIKYLSFRDKINLLNDNHASFIRFLNSESSKTRLLAELKVLYNKLCELSEFRNKVAHANWQSLDTAGFVRTKITENKDKYGIQFEKVKMTPGVLVKFRKQNESMTNRLDMFREKIWATYNREDFRRTQKIERESHEKGPINRLVS